MALTHKLQERKSLRDQWLMEGAPLSPTSQSPRSPLWGAQEIETRIDKLQSESQQFEQEVEKLKEQMKHGQTEAVKVAEAGAEMIVQNGDNNAIGSDKVKTNQSARLDETAAVLTNGGGDMEADPSHDTTTTNGPVGSSEGVTSMTLEPELSLGVSEAEPGRVLNAKVNGEEEEGTVVMRAECVIITDDGDDVSKDLAPQEDQQENMQSEETPLPNPEGGQDGGEDVEEVVETEAAPETFTQPEKSEATERIAEAPPATGDGDVQRGAKTNEKGDRETKTEGQHRQWEDPTSVQVQSPASAPDGTAVVLVPVYSKVQPSTLTLELEAEAEAEAALKAQDPAPVPSQFQEVPLADPQEIQRTEARPEEREPLLSQAKAADTQAKPAAAASTETHSPTRASQGEETQAPKHKTCQCCSVM
ncbi:paralemmin-3 isoform X2 [Perca flavescens]|uniref:paralemmin-3 isoform X2 n=1 Tax=Perca flavescens TaxID=8167 RepID=UPI00106E3BF1|nr:immunoglobulin A1 protease autotransporter-like isoform X2 [Perca flavescens]XP_028454109.1 immunoglobulin A1 protease autotransporter-like isoform X2 [Perca flavescens]